MASQTFKWRYLKFLHTLLRMKKPNIKGIDSADFVQLIFWFLSRGSTLSFALQNTHLPERGLTSRILLIVDIPEFEFSLAQAPWRDMECFLNALVLLIKLMIHINTKVARWNYLFGIVFPSNLPCTYNGSCLFRQNTHKN